MEDYLRNTVTKYCDLARKITGQAPALRSASTPFLHEDHKDAPAAMAKDTGRFVSCPWCKHSFPTEDGTASNPKNDPLKKEVQCRSRHDGNRQ